MVVVVVVGLFNETFNCGTCSILNGQLAFDEEVNANISEENLPVFPCVASPSPALLPFLTAAADSIDSPLLLKSANSYLPHAHAMRAVR